MTPEELLRPYIDTWNAQQGAEMANLYAEHAERISPLGLSSGHDAFRASAERFWEAFPDSRVTTRQKGTCSSASSQMRAPTPVP